MRITADIFDDEFNFDNDGDFNKTPELRANTLNSSLKLPSCFQFNTSSAFKSRRCRWRARRQKCLQTHNVNEVAEKLQHLHLSNHSPKPAFTYPIPKLQQTSDSTKMEKLNVNPSSSDSGDTAPTWLQQYLLNMKHEIKKEILEELMATPEHEKQSSNAILLDENELNYLGEIIHEGIYCDNCDQVIRGIRYKCGNCSDFDLCQECESLPNVHNKNHIFLKVRTPIALKGYQRQKWQELMQPSCSQLYAMGTKNRQAKKLYTAQFVNDETIPDGTVVPPSTKFVKSWRVVNNGTRVWTHSTRLHLIQGSPDLWPSSEHVDVPHLKPGESGVVSVQFTSPANEGVHRSHWNFCHRGRPFGDIVWCHINVKKETKSAQSTKNNTPLQITSANEVKVESPKINEGDAEKKQSDMSCVAQVLAAVQEVSTMVPRKLAVTSHTATPTNTPFDLSPPKSPDHHEAALKELQELNNGNSKITITLNESDHEDECSIVSVSSTESDAEFVIVPLPKCFDFDQAFTLSHSIQEIEAKKSPSARSPKKASEAQISNTEVPKLFPVHKTISQETGVPELSESDHQVVIQVQHSSNKQPASVVAMSDPSSEISIIGSGGSSPVSDDLPQDSKAISVTVLQDGLSNIQIAQQCEQSVQVTIESEELTEEASNSTTFPKFPVEDMTNVFDPIPTGNEERTVPMLPESLMTGALSAAATVYNTARDIITNIQQPREEKGSSAMIQLVEMGFCNRLLNDTLLKKHRGDLSLVVADLVNMNDNDWYASRHNPTSPPPPFD